MVSRPLSFVNGMLLIGGFKNWFFCLFFVCLFVCFYLFIYYFLGQRWRKIFWWLLIHNPFNNVFRAKISIFVFVFVLFCFVLLCFVLFCFVLFCFFQLNGMTDEPQTCWVFYGPNVASSYLF